MDDLGAKILSNLNAAFTRDPDIDEYDFLPIDGPLRNKNPVIIDGHKVALELWAVKILYLYAHSRLVGCNLKETGRKALGVEEVISLSRAALLVNADFMSAWNKRRELVLEAELSVDQDLRLTELILRKHPKSPETFSYRKWLLLKRRKRHKNPSRGIHSVDTSYVPARSVTNSCCECVRQTARCHADVTNTSTSPGGDSGAICVLNDTDRKLVQHEIEVCTCAADKYPNNYNAWSHRSWLIQQFASGDIQLLERELQTTHEFVSVHVSDHSGFHHRQFLLEQLHKFSPEGSDVGKLLHDEWMMTGDLIRRYVGHEAIWCHRRFVLHRLAALGVAVQCAHCLQSQSAVYSPKKTKLESSEIDWNDLLKKEDTFCASVTQETTSDWQKTLARKHLQWLHRTCHHDNLL